MYSSSIHYSSHSAIPIHNISIQPPTFIVSSLEKYIHMPRIKTAPQQAYPYTQTAALCLRICGYTTVTIQSTPDLCDFHSLYQGGLVVSCGDFGGLLFIFFLHRDRRSSFGGELIILVVVTVLFFFGTFQFWLYPD